MVVECMGQATAVVVMEVTAAMEVVMVVMVEAMEEVTEVDIVVLTIMEGEEVGEAGMEEVGITEEDITTDNSNNSEFLESTIELT
jgi:hypothetical protein